MKLRIPKAGAGGAAAGGGAPAVANMRDVPTGSAKPGGSYRVARGETLETISKKVYGAKTRWPDLWVANLTLLEDPSDIREGMTLQLPK
jgi:nucleoid-associated protein YgaU